MELYLMCGRLHVSVLYIRVMISYEWRTLHGYNTKNKNLPSLFNVRTDWGKRVTYYRALQDWTSLPVYLRKPMPISIFM